MQLSRRFKGPWKVCIQIPGIQGFHGAVWSLHATGATWNTADVQHDRKCFSMFPACYFRLHLLSGASSMEHPPLANYSWKISFMMQYAVKLKTISEWSNLCSDYSIYSIALFNLKILPHANETITLEYPANAERFLGKQDLDPGACKTHSLFSFQDNLFTGKGLYWHVPGKAQVTVFFFFSLQLARLFRELWNE